MPLLLNLQVLPQRKSTLIGYACAIAAAAFFGSVTTLSKPILSNMSPILLSSLVYLISGITFTPIVQRNQRKKPQESITFW